LYYLCVLCIKYYIIKYIRYVKLLNVLRDDNCFCNLFH